LHEYLEASGAFVTRHVNGIVLTIINTEQYDERLRAFALHQMDSGTRARDLGSATDDPALGQLLGDMYDAHVRSAVWSEQRASQFASSRSLEFQTSAERHSGPHEADASLPASSGGPRDPISTSPPSSEADDHSEDGGTWSEDSHRPPAARENYPIDDE
jgi:hypothetical protein